MRSESFSRIKASPLPKLALAVLVSFLLVRYFKYLFSFLYPYLDHAIHAVPLPPAVWSVLSLIVDRVLSYIIFGLPVLYGLKYMCNEEIPLSERSYVLALGLFSSLLLLIAAPALVGIKSVSEIIPNILRASPFLAAIIICSVLILLALRDFESHKFFSFPNLSLLMVSLIVVFENIVISWHLFSVADSPQSRILSSLFILPLPLTVLLLILSDVRVRFPENTVRCDDSEFLKFVQLLKNKAGISQDVEVYVAPFVSGAARVSGIRKVRILISQDLYRSYSSIPWLAECILLHELGHVKNRDTFVREFSSSVKRSCIITVPVLLFGMILLQEYLFHVLLLLVFNTALIAALEKRVLVEYEVLSDLHAHESGSRILQALKMLHSIGGGDETILRRIRFLENPAEGLWKSFDSHNTVLGSLLVGYLFFSQLLAKVPNSVLYVLFLIGAVFNFSYILLTELQMSVIKKYFSREISSAQEMRFT
jgi:Zn-dependent protease with chaperone function